MSPKSRQPKSKKKGRRGRKKEELSETTIVIEEPPVGPPFGLIVLCALVVSIPSLMAFVDGAMAFDATALRFLAALAVCWLLVNLVYAVAKSFVKEETQESTTRTTVENLPYDDPNAAFRLPADTPN